MKKRLQRTLLAVTAASSLLTSGDTSSHATHHEPTPQAAVQPEASCYDITPAYGEGTSVQEDDVIYRTLGVTLLKYLNASCAKPDIAGTFARDDNQETVTMELRTGDSAADYILGLAVEKDGLNSVNANLITNYTIRQQGAEAFAIDAQFDGANWINLGDSGDAGALANEAQHVLEMSAQLSGVPVPR